MTRRPSDTKIPDIKMVRGFTRFLGKVGITRCFSKHWETVYQFDPDGNQIGTTQELKYFYGWGLKESKDYVERKYHYVVTPEPYNPLREIQHGNQIAQIKATRVFMWFLQKLSIKNADPGLKVCKFYTDRLRADR